MSDPRAQAQAEAMALEQAGDLAAALDAYGRALAATPDDPDLLAALARLAGRMQMHPVAEAFWRRALAVEPARLEAVDGLVRALRDQHRYGEALAVAQAAVRDHPGDARLWNALGVVLTQQGDPQAALAVFEQAVSLDPGLASARYNLGGARMDLGDVAGARAEFDAALALATAPGDRAMIAFASAQARLAQGRLAQGGVAEGEVAQGWAAYEARVSPDLPDPVAFDIPAPRWRPGEALAGRRLLVVAEQGVGDEAMFAGVLPEVAEALGPHGRLALAVDARLVPLFRRSFPGAVVSAHATRRQGGRAVRSAPGAGPAELWTPMASLLQDVRPSVESFPRRAYLVPDPARVAHWRGVLAALPGPRVGLSWRSGKLGGERHRHYPVLPDWAGVLATPGASFVALQYGAEPEELDALDRMAAAPVFRPAGIDLRNDLDELCALACALDLLVSVPNATAALAAACGTETWFLAGPSSWARLGTGGYPWYARAEAFAAEAFGAYGPALGRLAGALGRRAREE